jgi:hypothetical protein
MPQAVAGIRWRTPFLVQSNSRLPSRPRPTIKPADEVHDRMSTEHKRVEAAARGRADRILSDDDGVIPVFPPRQVDSDGRLIPLSTEERRARKSAALRALAAIRQLPDNDPPGTAEQMMRGIDEFRPPGQKLFEGMY